MRIRLARADEAAELAAIEDEAGHIFASAGLPPDLEGLDPTVIEAAIGTDPHSARSSAATT